MSYQITDCQALEPGQLCAAMNAAFADYSVPLRMTVDKFIHFQKQRGFSARHSFVALAGSEIAGFWFSSVPLSSYGKRGYAVSVGTAPQHRRRGISRQLQQAVTKAQLADGGTGLQLEVISTNEKAISAYEAFGFTRQRTIRVCKLEKAGLPVSVRDGYEIKHISVEDLPDDESTYFDTAPTPQNSRASLLALRGKIHLVGVTKGASLLGWGAVNGDGSVAQIAVHRDHRRSGIGSALLENLGQSVDAEQLTFVNVDVAATGVNAFLDQAGAVDILQQLEMHLFF